MVLVFVTGNKHKFKEFENFLNIDLERIDLDLIEIQGTSEEIIKFKAEQAHKMLKKPCLVEDTSLGFKKWNYLPGPYIKDFNKIIGVENYYKLLGNENDAKVSCYIAYIDDKGTKIFRGDVNGKIVPPRRDNGFDFDRAFVPEGYDKTYSEMSIDEKNKISHRGRALKKLKEWLNNNG